MSLLILTLIFFDGMFHLARNEWIRVLLENAQAGAGAEINPLAAIDNAGKVCRVFERASADSFIFRRWNGGSFSQSSIFLMM